MNYITKYELDNKELSSKFYIENGNLICNIDTIYKDDFEVGDIVTYKNDTKKIGVVSFIDEDKVNIIWNDNSESEEMNTDLLIIPPTIGVQLIKNSELLKLWENLSNGKDDSFDLKCIYINDEMINEVPFIKSYKNTNTLVDKKFRRNFYLYRKFGNCQIYRANIYTVSNENILFDNSRFAYYLLQDNIVYFLGIDLSPDDLTTYLFKK